MTVEEVVNYLTQMTEYFENRIKHAARDQRRQLTAYMNAAAEAAVLLMGEEDDGK